MGRVGGGGAVQPAETASAKVLGQKSVWCLREKTKVAGVTGEQGREC